MDENVRLEITKSLGLLDTMPEQEFDEIVELASTTFGHAAGDEALRYLGKMLLENARIEDLPVRIGGDEFALLLPETGMEQARIIAERIRSLARKFGEGTAILSLSIGIATLDSGMKNWQELIERADISLYRAKAAGRNRVATSNDTGIHLARTSPAKLSIAS